VYPKQRHVYPDRLFRKTTQSGIKLYVPGGDDMKTALLLLAMLLPSLATAAIQKLDASGGGVDIVAKGHPNFLRVIGHGSPASGALAIDGDKVSGQLEFDLTSLETGIDTRDRHMKEKYLEVEKYPKATLNIQKVGHLAAWTLANPTINEDTFEGMLTLHGVTKPVSGKFSMTSDRAVEANFTVKLSNFGVAIPQFGGITIADDVDIDVKIGNLTQKL
jgi:polyisoprenoid-binding protein YceI